MKYDPVLPSESFVDKHDARLGGHVKRTLISLKDPNNYIAIADLSRTGIPVLYFALRESATKQFNLILELTTKEYQYVIENAIDIIRWAFNKMQNQNTACAGSC